jgi:hypothetical protein
LNLAAFSISPHVLCLLCLFVAIQFWRFDSRL